MKKFLKIIRNIFLFFILILTILCFYVGYQGYSLYKQTISEISVDEKISEIQNNLNFVSIEELPTDFINAVIDVEDNRFYSHSGIDFRSIGRAVYINIKNFDFIEGGSTITQQVCKNVFFSQKKEATRKIAEIFLAIDLEKKLDKDDIFELYVNTNFYGNGYYGIKQASNGYFDKEPIDMNLYESSLIAGVPNAPSVYAPTVNPVLCGQRQIQVLNAMIKYGHITEEQKQNLLPLINK